MMTRQGRCCVSGPVAGHAGDIAGSPPAMFEGVVRLVSQKYYAFMLYSKDRKIPSKGRSNLRL